MDFKLFYQLKNREPQWVLYLWYGTVSLFVIAIFCYCLFAVKIYFQNEKIAKLDEKISMYGTNEQKKSEQKLFEWKQSIEEFGSLVQNHKNALNVFNFIEQKTLPNVWFSGITISEAKDEVNLLGETTDALTLSRQVDAFEKSKEYVKAIGILNSQATEDAAVRFTLNISLAPEIFTQDPIKTSGPL